MVVPAVQQLGEVSGTGPEHGVHDDVQTRSPDAIYVHKRGNMSQVWSLGVDVLQKAPALRFRQRHAARRTRCLRVCDVRLQDVYDGLRGAAPVVRLVLEPVPAGRIVAGRNDNAGPGASRDEVV